MRIVSLIGFKGGIGRTASAAALTVGFAALGQRVVAIDAGFAVPLEEENRPEFLGLGSSPPTGHLQYLIDKSPLFPEEENHPIVRKVSSASYFEAVIEEMSSVGCSYAVVDTPAHQVPVVFATILRSSLLVVPVREPADVASVTASVEENFVASTDNLQFLISGAQQPKLLRHLLHPRAGLDAELPQKSDRYSRHEGNSVCRERESTWETGCMQLATEVSKILEDGRVI